MDENKNVIEEKNVTEEKNVIEVMRQTSELHWPAAIICFILICKEVKQGSIIKR